MIYIITNHHETLKWLPIQSDYLNKNTTAEYHVVCGTTDIKDSPPPLDNYAFDILENVPNNHADKLNYLFNLVDNDQNFSEEDLLVFLDPDAFPIVEGWDQELHKHIVQGGVPLIAVSREENPEPLLTEDQKPYPHPCFLATTLKFWKENNLSWELDPSQGASTAGVLLKKWLDKNNITWAKLLRTNCFNLHPLNFAVYGNMIYHHGSGNRPVYDSIDVWSRPELSKKYGVSLDLYHPELLEFNQKLSDLVFNYIKNDKGFIRMYFEGKE